MYKPWNGHLEGEQPYCFGCILQSTLPKITEFLWKSMWRRLLSHANWRSFDLWKKSKMVWSVLLLLEETKQSNMSFRRFFSQLLLTSWWDSTWVCVYIEIYIYISLIKVCGALHKHDMYISIYKFLAPWDAPNNKWASHWSWSSTTWHSTKTYSMYTHLMAD